MNRTYFLQYAACACIALFLFSASAYRATYSSFTHDEAYSYQWVLPGTFSDIATYGFPTPNNHILNSLAMKFSKEYLGAHTAIGYRWQSLLAQVFFLVYGFLLLKRLLPVQILVPAFIVLNANPYVLDYFTLARGYGISLAGLMAFLYYYALYLDQKRIPDLIKGLSGLLISVVSNFNVIPILPAILLANTIVQYKDIAIRYDSRVKKAFFFITVNWPFMLFYVLTGLIVYGPIQSLIEKNLLYIGGTNSFWDDTILSLVYTFLYAHSTEMTIAILKITISVLFVTAVLKASKWLIVPGYSSTYHAFFIFMVASLLLSVVVSISQHVILGSNYQTGRTALSYYLLFCLIGILLMATIKYRWVPYILCIPFLLHYMECYSVKYQADFEYDQNTKKMMDDLRVIIPQRSAEPVKLGITWLFEPAINFYIENGNGFIQRVDRDGMAPQRGHQYYYLLKEDLVVLDSLPVDTLRFYTETNTYLLKRK